VANLKRGKGKAEQGGYANGKEKRQGCVKTVKTSLEQELRANLHGPGQNGGTGWRDWVGGRGRQEVKWGWTNRRGRTVESRCRVTHWGVRAGGDMLWGKTVDSGVLKTQGRLPRVVIGKKTRYGLGGKTRARKN